jgi:hypothetical protein
MSVVVFNPDGFAAVAASPGSSSTAPLEVLCRFFTSA